MPDQIMQTRQFASVRHLYNRLNCIKLTRNRADATALIANGHFLWKWNTQNRGKAASINGRSIRLIIELSVFALDNGLSQEIRPFQPFDSQIARPIQYLSMHSHSLVMCVCAHGHRITPGLHINIHIYFLCLIEIRLQLSRSGGQQQKITSCIHK